MFFLGLVERLHQAEGLFLLHIWRVRADNALSSIFIDNAQLESCHSFVMHGDGCDKEELRNCACRRKPAPRGLLLRALPSDDHHFSNIVAFNFHAGDDMILAALELVGCAA
eukprot:1138058-Pelagomonas_calceolata.AAC.3